MEQYKSLQYKTKANDVDEAKGIVVIDVNAFGVKDSQGDISMPGSFKKTLQEGFGRVKWLRNHRTDQQIGVPIEGAEVDNNLRIKGALHMGTQMGREIFEMYKLNAEYGRTLEHSIGVRAIKRDETDKAKVKEWQLFEFSTLDAWGANPKTGLVDIKSATPEQVKDAIDFLRFAIKEGDFEDATKEKHDMELQLLLKSLNGGNIVTCPCCGEKFDYDEQDEITFSQQVLDLANMYILWMTEDEVREQMRSLAPEIQSQVIEVLAAAGIIDGTASKEERMAIIEKGIKDTMTYVRCPKCWSKVYKNNMLIKPETDDVMKEEPAVATQPEEQPAEEVTKAAEEGTIDLEKLSHCFE